MPARTFNLSVNGQARTVSVADDTEPLLFVLRNQLDQRGPKFGCGISQCGACTVLVNGTITRSCVALARTIPDGAQVTTLDGLGTAAAPHPLQRAFIEEQAGQCAFCVNGMIVGALGWLQGRFAAGNRAVPTEDEIKQFLSGKLSTTAPLSFVYLCRCGTHPRIVRAIQRAAKEMA
jgi:aerobic-type carbon monoxide dehydrogenase small subunit (CoxS/CutS family)